MEILTPAIQQDNKNIRAYWNMEKCTVVLLITDLENTKRVIRKDYTPLVYNSIEDYEDVEQIRQMFARDIRGKLNVYFDLNIGFDNADKLANALINYSDLNNVIGRKVPANEELAKIDNKEFGRIFQEVQQEVEQVNLEDPNQNVETSTNSNKTYIKNNNLGKTPKNTFKDYINQFHKNELYNINNGDELPQTIVIDWQNLKRFDKELAKLIIEKPKDTLELMEVGLMELTTNKVLNIDEDVNIRFDNLEVTQTKHLLANKIGQMVQTEGIIKGVLEPSFYYTNAVFECTACHRLQDVPQNSKNKILEPSLCSECGGRSFKLMEEESTAKDLKYIRLQEPTDNLSTDESPRNIIVCLTGNLSHNIGNGQRVKITGILEGNTDDKGKRKFVLDANHVVKLEDKKIEISDEDMEKILELSKDPKIIDRLIKSFGYNTFGHKSLILDNEVILAMLCFIVKAGYSANGRDMIHILIISDPSMGKTKLKDYTFNLSEKGIKASGTNASGVGLTVSVDKDPILNTQILLPGAIPLAHKGHAFIDEFEKLKDDEAKRLLNYMESGEDTVNKWGLNETMHGATSILALANPILGRFNKFETVQSQIKIYAPLQSRFDLIIVLEDRVNQEKDKMIAKSIVNGYRKPNTNVEVIDDDIIPFDLLKKYLAYAKNNYQPEIGQELDGTLLEYQNKARAGAEEGDVLSFDWRAYESIIRLSGAIAKLRHDNTVNAEDLQRAMDLKKYSFESVGQDPITGKIDIDRVNGNNDNADRTNRMHIKQVLNQYLEDNPNIIKAMPKKLLIEECQKTPVNGKGKGISKNTFYERYRELRKTGTVKEFKSNGETYVKFDL